MEKIIIVVFAAFVCGAIGATVGDINSRIIGGYPAPDNQFLYQASLRGKDGKHICGAVVIKKNFLLTTCRCVEGIPASDLSVVVSTKFLNQGGDKHQVSVAVCHENYNDVDLPRNDIALLKVATPLNIGEKVKTIPLENADVDAHVEVVVSGWGASSHNDATLADKLRFARLFTITNAECGERLFPNGVAFNQLCTFVAHSQGLCDGDAGGPLVAYGKLVGLASWGKNCADGYPDVYTKISSYVPWVFNNINDNK